MALYPFHFFFFPFLRFGGWAGGSPWIFKGWAAFGARRTSTATIRDALSLYCTGAAQWDGRQQ